MSLLRFLLLSVPLLLVAGCDSEPETQPMDEPLDAASALEADQRMQESRERLLEEQSRD